VAAAGAAGANQTIKPVLDQQRRDRRNLDELMPKRIWVFSLQQVAAAAADIQVVLITGYFSH
jgi:hypothetical protein